MTTSYCVHHEPSRGNHGRTVVLTTSVDIAHYTFETLSHIARDDDIVVLAADVWSPAERVLRICKQTPHGRLFLDEQEPLPAWVALGKIA